MLSISSYKYRLSFFVAVCYNIIATALYVVANRVFIGDL
nr:MAG TPA: hypothetical protein [Caudoviricetes sp.]